MIIVRYTHPEVLDDYLCRTPSGLSCWISGLRYGRERAIRFATAAYAKALLVTDGYDLPPLKVTFEEVDCR